MQGQEYNEMTQMTTAHAGTTSRRRGNCYKKNYRSMSLLKGCNKRKNTRRLDKISNHFKYKRKGVNSK